MSRNLIILILLTWVNILFSQSILNDSINKQLIKKLNIIEKSTSSISNKVDSCCKKKKSFNKNSTTNIKLESLLEINSKIDLTIKKVDSSNITINSKIDSCCSKHNILIEPKEPKEINHCYCIYKVAGIILFIFVVILIIAFISLEKEEYIKLAKENLIKVIPQLPFILIVWTIGFCLFTNVYCKIDFNNLSSINYNHQLLLLFSISLILLPFLKTIKFGKYFELERNVQETKEEVRTFKGEMTQNFHSLMNTVTATMSSISTQAQTVNNHFQGFGPPLSDDSLEQRNKEIHEILKELREHSIGLSSQFNSNIDVPIENIEMFKVRFNIEVQLRRIWENRYSKGELEPKYKFQSTLKIIQDLTRWGIIDDNIYSILREILAVCNYAIHGEKVTKIQVEFVTKNAREVIEYLRQLN